jgi:hypothetical protein
MDRHKLMGKTAAKDTMVCDICGKPLDQDENKIGRKCQECLAEEESCGCSDV